MGPAERRAPSSTAVRARRVTGVLAALLLAGCAVGPDFAPPAPPTVPTYTSSALPETLAPGFDEAEQRLANGQTVAADWWQLFHSAPLSAVLAEAIARNQDLAAANATLAQAQEAVNQARGAFYPQIDLALSARREQTTSLRSNSSRSGNHGGGTSVDNLYSLGPSISYSPDVFGLTRRQVEQQQALARSQAYQLAAAYLTLTGNVVSQAINIASARLQITATEDIIADDEQNLTLVQAKFKAGKAARTDVLIAESQLTNDRTLLPPLRQQLSVAQHALAVLRGRFPGQTPDLDFELAAFTLPGELPVSLPSQLVRQRPDILAAEANLHAASAALGVATAQLYPTVTLSASFGFEFERPRRSVPGLERDLEPDRGPDRAGVPRRRPAGAGARCGRCAPGLARDLSADRAHGLRPGRRHAAGARQRRRSGRRRAARAGRGQRLARPPAPELRGGQVGPAPAARLRAALPAGPARLCARPGPAFPGHDPAVRRHGRRLVGEPGSGDRPGRARASRRRSDRLIRCSKLGRGFSEALLVGAQIELLRPGGAALSVDVPIGVGDRIDAEQPVLATLG